MNCVPEPIPEPAPAGRGTWSILVRVAVGAAIILGILATQRIDGKALGETLRRVNLWLLAATAASFPFLMAAKSWRWNILVRHAGLRYGFWSSFRSYLAAFALGIVTPGRLGELARAAQIRNELGAAWEPCVRSVIADRLFDLVFLCSFGPFALAAVMAGRTFDGLLAAGFVGVYVAASICLAAAGRFVARWRPRWRPLRFGVTCIGNVAGDLVGRTGIACSAVTLLSYGIYFGASLVLFRAIGIHLSFQDVACVTGCLSLVLLLPISIAGIGPREATLIVLLGMYGVSREDALAYSILQFVAFTLFGGLVGGLALAALPRTGSAANPARVERGSEP
jgi:glycosyltransferase 2 family protein